MEGRLSRWSENAVLCNWSPRQRPLSYAQECPREYSGMPEMQPEINFSELGLSIRIMWVECVDSMMQIRASGRHHVLWSRHYLKKNDNFRDENMC